MAEDSCKEQFSFGEDLIEGWEHWEIKGFNRLGGLLCWPLSLALQYEGTGRAIRLLVALLVAAGTPGLAHRPARVQVTVTSDQD